MSRRQSGLRLNQILLGVGDIDRSKEFYSKKLGLKVQYDFSPGYVAIRTTNDIQIGLHPANRQSAGRNAKKQSTGIEFEVDNVDSWYRRLKKRGVSFSQKPKNSPWGEREARFRDPDGYRLAISAPSKGK